MWGFSFFRLLARRLGVWGSDRWAGFLDVLDIHQYMIRDSAIHVDTMQVLLDRSDSLIGAIRVRGMCLTLLRLRQLKIVIRSLSPPRVANFRSRRLSLCTRGTTP